MKQPQHEEKKQMKQRQATFAAFEQEILDLYERQELNARLLDHIGSLYQQIDMDCIGSQGLLTHDGKDLCQICIGLLDPSFPLVARGSSEDHEEYWEREINKWEEILYTRWQWKRARTNAPCSPRQNAA